MDALTRSIKHALLWQSGRLCRGEFDSLFLFSSELGDRMLMGNGHQLIQ
jgi:hypothetical protein